MQWIKVIVVVVVLVSVSGGVVAQDDRAPDLVIFYAEDVWTLGGGVGTEPQPHAFCGTGYSDERRWSPLVISPDGAHLAYLTMPENEGFSGPTPTNVRLCRGGEQVDMLIGPQPDAWVLGAGDSGFAYHAQSRPVWSPDGVWLAWTALYNPAGDDTLTLYAYDVGTGELRSVTRDFPQPFGIPTTLPVAWVEDGIVVAGDTFAEPVLRVYGVEGDLRHEFPVPADPDHIVINDIFGVDVGGQAMLAVEFQHGLIELLDLTTGEWRALEGTLQLYVPDAPAESLAVNYSMLGEFEGEWEIVTPDGMHIPLDHADTRTAFSVALAPDGQAVAYGTYQAFVWRAGEVTTLQFPNAGDVMPYISVVWAPPAWRVVED